MLVKVLTGESLFMTAFINQDNVKGVFCFIRKNSTIFSRKISVKKVLSLCSKGVSVELNSLKLGRGFFGGEGFTKNRGDGLAFVHSGGTLAKKELEQAKS
jgi:uncharacterized protein (AIM24 family)